MSFEKSVFKVGAVDPGKTNPAAWLGLCDVKNAKVTTLWGAASEDITAPAKESRGAKKGEATICEVGVEIGKLLAEKCDGVDGVVVETPATFTGKGCFVNVGAAVGAGATYGYLCGKGIPNVCMSHSRTKSRAMDYFAEVMGMALQEHVAGTDKAAKAKNRLINKRNSKAVVEMLLRFSGDEAGMNLMETHSDKRDDLCDAILLACGTCIPTKTKKSSKKQSKL